MVNKALRHDSDNDTDELHLRDQDQTVSATKKERVHTFTPRKAFPEIIHIAADITPDPYPDAELVGQISDFNTKMRNRARIVNAAIIAGSASLLVASYSAMSFAIVMFASPEFIVKVRYMKFGMSVSGSACMFINAACIFVLCVEMKYAIEHYVRKPKL